MSQIYAVKGNREIAVNNDAEKEQLKKAGYDIVNKQGELLEPGRGKTVPYEQYEALEQENAALCEQLEAFKKKK